MRVVLEGCPPEPLGSYLAGLGIFRLVAEQADPAATAAWTPTGLAITSVLDRDGLARFLLHDYAPTPLVSPWNAGGGFAPGTSSRTASEALTAIEHSTAPRLAACRAAIAVGREITGDLADKAAFAAAKDRIIARARAALPDEALQWLDASVVLTTDGVVFPHILGTGGNLGRLDLTANANLHLARIMDLSSGAPTTTSAAWLAAVLDGTQTAPRVGGGVGQYSPGAAGGVNASTQDGGPALVNPWEFLLTLEGAVLFASAAARRLGSSGPGVAAMPFTVHAAPVGAGHLASGEQPKGELWLPLWDQEVRLGELRRLIGEGRLRWGRRHATNAIDAARAITTLGADRGVSAFLRVTVAERLGQSPLAVPAGRVLPDRSPEVAATVALDGWLARIRRADVPQAVTAALHVIDERMLRLATARPARRREALVNLLDAVATLDTLVARNAKLRDVIPPLRWLNPEVWLPLIDDGSAEFRVAAGFASLRMAPKAGEHVASPTWRRSFSQYLRPVAWDGRWVEGPAVVPDVVVSGVVRTAAAVHRLHAQFPMPFDPQTSEAHHRARGVDTVLALGRWVPTSAAEPFVAGDLDDRVIARLVRILCLVNPFGSWPAGEDREPARAPMRPVPGWRALTPFFAADQVTVRWDGAGARTVRLAASPSWPTRLSASWGPRTVIAQALQRLRVAGLRSAFERDPRRAADALGGLPTPDAGERLAAALLLRLPRGAVAAHLQAMTTAPDAATSTS